MSLETGRFVYLIPKPRRNTAGLQLNMVPTAHGQIDSGFIRLHPEISLEITRDQERINNTPVTLAYPHAYSSGPDLRSSLPQKLPLSGYGQSRKAKSRLCDM